MSLEHVDNILEVDRLSIGFGDIDVFTNVTFALPRGSSMAVIGPNGAGKTVLLRALLGSIPHRGCVRWASATHIGYVPQKLDLDRDIPMTGHDFLRARLALACRNGPSPSDVLQMVGLTGESAEKPIGKLSGGQFQRLLIAFALVGLPDVLMLDEPTAGVDEPGQEQINSLLQRLQREQHLTILFISHDLSVVYKHADQVLCLGRRQSYVGAPRQILTPELLEELYGMPLRYHTHDD